MSGSFEEYLRLFMKYLEVDKRASENTRQAYKRDVQEFARELEERGIGVTEATSTEVVGYLLRLKSSGKSASTSNRKVASLRAFYGYLRKTGAVSDDPTANIKSPKVERREIEYLTIEEVDKLLSLPDDSPLGKRDRALLEILYATGIRVSEIVNANVSDVNLRMGFITCSGEHGTARIIPMGRPARAAAEEYIYDVRPQMVGKDSEERALFVNYSGERMTRQGLWKVIKKYAKDAGIENKITPQTLRNSFAVHMIQNGADLKSLQELMGHQDITATQIYLSVTKNRIKEVYDRTHPRA